MLVGQDIAVGAEDEAGAETRITSYNVCYTKLLREEVGGSIPLSSIFFVLSMADKFLFDHLSSRLKNNKVQTRPFSLAAPF